MIYTGEFIKHGSTADGSIPVEFVVTLPTTEVAIRKQLLVLKETAYLRIFNTSSDAAVPFHTSCVSPAHVLPLADIPQLYDLLVAMDAGHVSEAVGAACGSSQVYALRWGVETMSVCQPTRRVTAVRCSPSMTMTTCLVSTLRLMWGGTACIAGGGAALFDNVHCRRRRAFQFEPHCPRECVFWPTFALPTASTKPHCAVASCRNKITAPCSRFTTCIYRQQFG